MRLTFSPNSIAIALSLFGRRIVEQPGEPALEARDRRLYAAREKALAQREADRVVVDRGHDPVEQRGVDARLGERDDRARGLLDVAQQVRGRRRDLLQRRQQPRMAQERVATVVRD